MAREDQSDATAELVDQVMRFMRAVHTMKMAKVKIPEGSERAAYGLLFPLVHRGDMRAAELAEAVHSDPSTVSRHIAHLIEKDLVRRVPDQQDGRASLLTLTNDGRALCDQLHDQRANVLAGLVTEWSERDLTELARLLDRFNTDMEAHLEAIVANMRNAFEAVTGPQDSDKETR